MAAGRVAPCLVVAILITTLLYIAINFRAGVPPSVDEAAAGPPKDLLQKDNTTLRKPLTPAMEAWQAMVQRIRADPNHPITISENLLAEHLAKTVGEGKGENGFRTTIPLMIHITHETTDVSDMIKSNVKIWQRMNPNATTVWWTATHREDLVRMHYPGVIDLFQALPKRVMRADLFGYMVLHQYGGIYSDADVYPLKPVSKWIPDKLRKSTSIQVVIGVEADINDPGWEKWYARSLQIAAWTFGGVANHPLFASALQLSLRRLQASWYANEPDPKRRWRTPDGNRLDPVEATGPAVLTDAAMHYMSQYGSVAFDDLHFLEASRCFGDVLLLPITAFSPGRGVMNSKPKSDPQAMVFHQQMGSWRDNDL